MMIGNESWDFVDAQGRLDDIHPERIRDVFLHRRVTLGDIQIEVASERVGI